LGAQSNGAVRSNPRSVVYHERGLWGKHGSHGEEGTSYRSLLLLNSLRPGLRAAKGVRRREMSQRKNIDKVPVKPLQKK